jgi:acetoacetyl-CoA synthetase
MAFCGSLSRCIFFELTIWTRNPGGVRFGSAEIYDVIDMCFSHSATLNPSHIIVDCLVVGQSIDGGMDERVILFVQLQAGEALSLDLQKKIKSEIRTRRTPRHVPAMVKYHNGCPRTWLIKLR